MALTWKISINGGTRQTLEAAGLTLVSGSIRTHGVSSMTLRRAVNFDAAESMSYGATVELSYQSGATDNPFFRGKVASVPKWGTGQAEGQDIVVEDAWADLQRTIYQESWNGISGAKTIPRAVFGMGPDGTARTVGAQAAAVATYGMPDLDIAVSVTGEVPIPSEIVNQTCEEVLLDCLRLHPDWIPWIDHSTTPSTFRITPIASAGAVTYGVTACSDLSVTKRDDLIPASVRIIYETIDTTDGTAKRSFEEDLYPLGGATSGPRVLSAWIALQGAETQTMKQRIFTQDYPKSEADLAKDWLKAHYPALRDVEDAAYSIITVNTEVVPDPTGVGGNPVNEDDDRFPVTEETPVEDLPRELVKGSIEDWMRYRVGEVIVTAQCEANGSATADELEILNGGLLEVRVRIIGTNAPLGSSVSTGVSNYTAGESAPTGIAQAVYEAITDSIPWQGSISVVAEDVPAAMLTGSKLRITGGVTAWATMDAPINAVDFDIASGTATIQFGPPGYLAPQDFLELQRTMRRRETRWFQTDERDSEELDTSGGGAVVGGYDLPLGIAFVPPGNSGSVNGAFYTTFVAADGHTYLQGGSVSGGTGTETAANIKIVDSGTGPTQTAGTHMYVIATGDGITDSGVLLPGWNLTNATIGYASTVPDNTLPTATDATGKLCHIDLGVFTSSGFLPAAVGNIQISHCLGSYSVSRDA